MKRENGITMITLIITIIVMLILVGVAFSMAGGEEGLLTQTQVAAEETTSTGDGETIKLAYDNCFINNRGKGTVSAADLQTELRKTYGDTVTVKESGSGYKISFSDPEKTYVFNGNDVEQKENTPLTLSIGQAVKYDVTYVDAQKPTVTFNENNGWRLLSYKANEADPDLYDIEIISTGVPVGIHYHYNIKSNPTIAGGWCATDTQIANYISKFYSSATSTDNNMYAAAGLYYNFEKLVFQNKTISAMKTENIKHYGCYQQINNVTGSNITGSIFRSTNENIKNKITGVRNITLADMTGVTTETKTFTDIDGLFLLSKLKTSEFASKYGLTDYAGQTMYWIASPYSTNAKSLYYMVSGGAMSSTGDPYGLRPIVSISGVSIEDVDGILELN